MRGLGLAHTLAQALDNSEASFGNNRSWKDEHINALTTRDGKTNILGPMLDVLRGDAEIVPKKRIIDTASLRPGDKVRGKDGEVVVLNRFRVGNTRLPRFLTLGNFKLGVASQSHTRHYEHEQSLGRPAQKPETHIDVPSDPHSLELNKRYLLPNYLVGTKLPGIALRDFYLDNPHHIPQCFSDLILFWGTICKNDWCYYVPGLYSDGSEYDMRVCTYRAVDGKDVITNFESFLGKPRDAAVFI